MDLTQQNPRKEKTTSVTGWSKVVIEIMEGGPTPLCLCVVMFKDTSTEYSSLRKDTSTDLL